MKRIVLVVVKGKDFGRSVVVYLGHCAMIGRSTELVGATMQVTSTSQLRLAEEDHKAVARHLKLRAPDKNGARPLLANFERDYDVQLRDDASSQCHGMIFCDEAGASLFDMGSTNGTYVNGKRVSAAELALGDLIRIGETRIEVRG
jgi:hypothetical protein